MVESGFELRDFLPFMLNQAAEEVGLGFARVYRERYGLLRTEWRVLAHLGSYGTMTATEIGAAARVHKTKISRAVRALETRRLLMRAEAESDRRQELLSLTDAGRAVFEDLATVARAYDREVAALFTPAEQEILRTCLRKLVGPEPSR